MATGKITAIRGVVVDVKFPEGDLPEIYEALNVEAPQGQLVLEVQQPVRGDDADEQNRQRKHRQQML